MKQFRCDCGRRVFFDNTLCNKCGAYLGFDPERLNMVSLKPSGQEHYSDQNGKRFRYCRNFAYNGACNWIIPADRKEAYCLGCERTEVIPSLDVPGNIRLWSRLEAAKRRLLYTLLDLGLPLQSADGSKQLSFRFLEDQRRNPSVEESFIGTGHFGGTITINLTEADDLERHATREQMQERYRTLLGHFRHESGHFYFDPLVIEQQKETAFRELFGDEQTEYQSTLEAFYQTGAPEDWTSSFVSAYASAHPHEDWAETFAHYLHIIDALETARAAGLVASYADEAPEWILEWIELSITMNELNRSLGLDDPYPFVLTDSVIKKLVFIDPLVRRLA